MPSTPSSFFVTGGSGFLGRRLIGVLRERGHEVRALARSEAALAAVQRAGALPVQGDLESVDLMAEGMRGCAAVFHCAAKAEDWGDPDEFMRINVLGTKNVIKAARAAQVPRLVHVSTEGVLLDGRTLVRVDETMPRADHPIGLYFSTKGLAEKEVLDANSAGLATVVVRPRFIWGKGDTTLLPRLCEIVKKGQFAWVSGGRHLTSTCHVVNVCEGIILAAERGRPGEIYFLTDGPPIEMREMLTAMMQTQGVDPGNRSIPFWLALALAWLAEQSSRLFGVPKRPPLTRTAVLLVGQEVTVSDAKARSELGYQAHVSREQGLKELGSVIK